MHVLRRHVAMPCFGGSGIGLFFLTNVGEHERPMRSACTRSAWRILRAIMIDLLNIQKLVRFVGCTACLVHGGCSVCAAKVGKKRQSTKSFLLNFHFFVFTTWTKWHRMPGKGLCPQPSVIKMRDASTTLAPRISVAIPLWGKKTWGRPTSAVLPASCREPRRGTPCSQPRSYPRCQADRPWGPTSP